MYRYQLALSETSQIITDFKNIKVEEIEDIYCRVNVPPSFEDANFLLSSCAIGVHV